MGLQLTDRRAGLERDGHRAQLAQCHVDDRVVDAGEAQHADPIAGPQRMLRRVGQAARDGAHALPQLPVGDGVEPGQQVERGAAGPRVRYELDGALRRAAGRSE